MVAPSTYCSMPPRVSEAGRATKNSGMKLARRMMLLPGWKWPTNGEADIMPPDIEPLSAQNCILIAYLLTGPAAWLGFGVAMLFAYGRMGRLRRPIEPLPATPPSVTVLMPAK